MRKLTRIVVVLAVTFVLGACSLIYDSPAADSCSLQQESVPVDFALSFESRKRFNTKASGSITELNIDNPSFRGISAISIIPFPYVDNRDVVQPGEQVTNESVIMPQIDGGDFAKKASVDGQTFYGGLVGNNYSHLYSGDASFLPLNTSRVLAYGYAAQLEPDTEHPDAKHLNGSWVEAGLTDATIEVDKITFSPEQIYTGSVPATAQSIVNILNNIAEGSKSFYNQKYSYKPDETWEDTSVPVRWDAITSPELQAAFKEFTNNGEMTTGAGKNVAYLLTRLYNALKTYQGAADLEYYKHRIGTNEYDAFLNKESEEKLTYNYMYLNLRDQLLGNFSDLAGSDQIIITQDANNNDWVVSLGGDLEDYPVSLGLPSGSAVIRWNGSKFVVVTEGMEGLASIKDFCYMPPLCYFANSAVKTTSNRFIYESYTDQQTWGLILEGYSNSPVSKTTRSVALVERLSSASAMLVATIQATSSMLADNDGNPTTYCLAKDKNFPVTGVIIGGQYRQGFDFKVDPGATEEYYLYDRTVSGVYLTDTQSQNMMTLVFPTKEEKDVYFLLELRNDTKDPFYGADGIILPGGYFYLSGVLEKPEDRDDYNPANPDQQECVFERDHYTIAHCKVETLENAMSTIPQLGDPQLILGIQTEQRWVYSYGSYVILE